MNIGLGTASFGTSIPEIQAHKILDTFYQSNGYIIDTANNYAFWAGSGGESEFVIGTWMSKVQRERIEIHTKIGAQPTDGVNFETAEGLSKIAIEAAVEASLKRLSTDYIDVLYAHLDDPKTPLLETWATLSSYVNNGTVKKLGISNYSLSRVIELSNVIQKNNLSPISYAQYRHSIISPIKDSDMGVQVCFDAEIIQTLKNANSKIKLIAYSPLLDGGLEKNGSLPQAYISPENINTVNQLQNDAKHQDVSPSALALKQIFDSGITPLTMTSNIERLKGNIKLFKQ